jgi:hypothetical protein
MKSDLCKECRKEPRMGPLQSRCSKCVKRRAKAKETAKKERLKVSKAKFKAKPTMKKADKVFQYCVRLRDFNGNTSESEKIPCFICGTEIPFRFSQPMHFIRRGVMQLRYDEDNCHTGCQRCNIFLKGNYVAYTLKMIEKYGKEKVDEMFEEQNRLSPNKTDFGAVIETYKAKTKELSGLSPVREEGESVD